MASEIMILTATAASIGFLHTLFGPDHYLPFIVMSKARNWTRTRTAIITALCGIGHVLSSIVLGLIGIALGITVSNLENVEGTRGNIAAWFLIAFGLVYFAWGLRRAWKNKPHTHPHIHLDGEEHEHEHDHTKEHSHVHETSEKKKITPWTLFIIFVLGPCEPLIPILMYPAAQSNGWGVILVASVFGIVTVLTMLSIVLMAYVGISFLPMKKVERFTHAIAGGTIALSGMAIIFLGL